MKSNYQLDKAVMAFKSQRFGECLVSYEAALNKEFSKEGWIGLSMSKLHLLSENQTPKDVKYSLDKTLELYPKSTQELSIELLKNAKYLLHKFGDLIIQLDIQIAKENQKKKYAAIASVASYALGSMSSTTKWSRRFKIATGAGLGYSLKKWGDEENTKVVRVGIYVLIVDILNIVKDFCEKNKVSAMDEMNQFFEDGQNTLDSAKPQQEILEKEISEDV